MLNINEIPKAWMNFKQIESDVAKYPTLFRFRLMDLVYFGAVDNKGKHWIRCAPISIKELTGCSAAKIKELQK